MVFSVLSLEAAQLNFTFARLSPGGYVVTVNNKHCCRPSLMVGGQRYAGYHLSLSLVTAAVKRSQAQTPKSAREVAAPCSQPAGRVTASFQTEGGTKHLSSEFHAEKP